MQLLVIHYQQLNLKRDSVKTCSSMIICEIIVRLLVIVKNNKICTVQVLN
jgi:hypothetical protein